MSLSGVPPMSIAAALADGELVIAVVRADDVAVGVDDLHRSLARLHGRLFLDDFRVTVFPERSRSRTTLFARDGKAGCSAVAHLGLGHVAEREQRFGQLRLGELEEKIGLVLGAIDRLAQREASAAAGDAW